MDLVSRPRWMFWDTRVTTRERRELAIRFISTGTPGIWSFLLSFSATLSPRVFSFLRSCHCVSAVSVSFRFLVFPLGPHSCSLALQKVPACPSRLL